MSLSTTLPVGVVPDPRPLDTAWPVTVWPPAPEAVLAGVGVELHPFRPADAPELHRAIADERVWAHLPFVVRSADDLADWARQKQEQGRVIWTIRSRVDAVVLGMTCCFNVSAHDARLEIGGTALAPTHWGTSVNAESKFLLLRHAFEEASMGRVQFHTDVRNVRSQRALAGIGATREGVLRRHQRRWDGTVRDSVLYSITADDWPLVRAVLTDRIVP